MSDSGKKITTWVVTGVMGACLYPNLCGHEAAHIDPRPVDLGAMRILPNPPLFATVSGTAIDLEKGIYWTVTRSSS